jgi:hypothetical protein
MRPDTVFNRLTFTKHQFTIGGHEWFISDIDDVPLRIFGSSANYQTCASSLLSLRFHMVASGHATMVVDIKETGDEGDVPILHRYEHTILQEHLPTQVHLR